MDQTPKTKWQSEAISQDPGVAPIPQPAGSDQLPPLPQLSLFKPLTTPPSSKTGAIEVDSGLHTEGKTIGVNFAKPKTVVAPALLPPAIETAEGYLELVTRPAVKLGVHSRMRRDFAKKSLQLAVDTGLCESSPKHEARRQMVIGQSLRLLRRYRAAAQAFREASKHRPSRVDALMALGWCQKRMGRSDQAVASLTRALSIAPEDARLHYNLACYLSISGQFRAAVYELAWALEIEPSLRRRALVEPDFDQLRSAPAFAALTSSRTSAK